MKWQSEGCPNEATNFIWCDKCLEELGEYIETHSISSHIKLKQEESDSTEDFESLIHKK